MPQTPTLGSTFVAMTVVELLFMVLFPVAVAVVAQRRLRVGWRYFWYGVLVFFLSQMVTRVPAVQVLQASFAPQLQASVSAQWLWIVGLALTAGIFEEVGRYLGYRFLMRGEEKTWPKIVLFGVGHGAIESMVLIAGLTAATLASLVALSSGGLDALPPDQRAVAAQQLAAVAAQPDWAPLLGAWERAWAMALHVGFSVLVLQVFRRGSLAWLWLAIGAHALADLAAAAAPQTLGRSFESTLFVEALLAVFGAIALWWTWRLRDPVPARAGDSSARPVSSVAS